MHKQRKSVISIITLIMTIYNAYATIIPDSYDLQIINSTTISNGQSLADCFNGVWSNGTPTDLVQPSAATKTYHSEINYPYICDLTRYPTSETRAAIKGIHFKMYSNLIRTYNNQYIGATPMVESNPALSIFTGGQHVFYHVNKTDDKGETKSYSVNPTYFVLTFPTANLEQDDKVLVFNSRYGGGSNKQFNGQYYTTLNPTLAAEGKGSTCYITGYSHKDYGYASKWYPYSQPNPKSPEMKVPMEFVSYGDYLKFVEHAK